MIDPTRRLSPHFTLGELLHSETAERIPALAAQQRNPPPQVIDNLQHLVTRTLEPLRQLLALPLHVTSGYRSPDLNRRVGGAPTSQHLLGQAADLHLVLAPSETAPLVRMLNIGARAYTGKPLRPDVAPDFLLFAWIALHLAALDVDQLIHEYGSGPGHPAWVHVSSSLGEGSRRQILLIDYRGTRSLDLLGVLALGA
jgi:hypothetical protein